MESFIKKHLRTVLLLLLSAVMLVMTVVPAAAYPAHDGYVSDGAAVLSESTVRQIKKYNEQLKDKNGTVMGVCTVVSTGDEKIEDYAAGVFTEWKITDGVLILIVTGAQNYYVVQSSGISSQITDEDLTRLRDEYIEPDFASGNYDAAVSKATTRLSAVLEKNVTAKSGSASEGSGFWKFIATLFKIILILVLIAAGIFVILFVIALFNDNVAALLRKYVFSKFTKKKTTPAQQRGYGYDYGYDSEYDERLYGRNGSQGRSQNQVNGQRRNVQNGQNGQYGRQQNR